MSEQTITIYSPESEILTALPEEYQAHEAAVERAKELAIWVGIGRISVPNAAMLVQETMGL